MRWSKSYNSPSSESGILPLLLLLHLRLYLSASQRPYAIGATRLQSRSANSIIAKYVYFIVSRTRQVKLRRPVDESIALHFDHPRRRAIISNERIQRDRIGTKIVLTATRSMCRLVVFCFPVDRLFGSCKAVLSGPDKSCDTTCCSQDYQ